MLLQGSVSFVAWNLVASFSEIISLYFPPHKLPALPFKTFQILILKQENVWSQCATYTVAKGELPLAELLS